MVDHISNLIGLIHIHLLLFFLDICLYINIIHINSYKIIPMSLTVAMFCSRALDKSPGNDVLGSPGRSGASEVGKWGANGEFYSFFNMENFIDFTGDQT